MAVANSVATFSVLFKGLNKCYKVLFLCMF